MESQPSPLGISIAPSAAQRISGAVCVLAGCGFLVAATIAVLDLLLARPVTGVTWLLIPGVPVLIAGQVWSIWILIGRLPPRRNRSWSPFRRRLRTTDLFAGLPPPAMVAVVAVFFLAWISGVSSFPYLQSGGPEPATRHCRYPLNDHGVVTCTDEATYYRAGRASQRLASSVLAAFFVFHLGISAAALRRRQRDS